MPAEAAPLVLVNAVGLTPRLLPHAGRLNTLAASGWVRPLTEVLPAVTCTAQVLRAERPELTLVYLPHLDYYPQRFGPHGCDMPRLVCELDDACAPLLDTARAAGARVWVVSEYGHVQISRAVLPNRVLRR